MTTRSIETWQRLHDGLRAFIAKRVSNAAEVDDLLQEVFLRIHLKIDGLKDPDRLVSWVYRITRHAIIDHYRAPVRRREVPAGLAGDIEAAGGLPLVPAGQPGDSSESRAELAGCLRPMIDQLAKDYREALVLVELAGLTQQAGAKRLGLSLSGMKSRVQRGRKHLKRMLDDCCLIQLDRRRGVMEYAVRRAGCDPCGGRPTEGRKPGRVAGSAKPC